MASDEQEADYEQRIKRSSDLFGERYQAFQQRVQACEAILAGAIDPPTMRSARHLAKEQVQAIEDDAIAASLQDRYPRKPAAHSSPESG